MIKLNLGCGNMPLKDYVNIDVTSNADVILDLAKNNYILPYGSSSVDEVYSSHFIEHLSLDDVLTLFDEIYRVLRPFGRIVCHTVDSDTVIARYRAKEVLEHEHYRFKKLSPKLRYIAATNFRIFHYNQKNHYQNHKSLWNYTSLKDVLETSKFKNINLIAKNETHKDYDLAIEAIK